MPWYHGLTSLRFLEVSPQEKNKHFTFNFAFIEKQPLKAAKSHSSSKNVFKKDFRRN